MEHGYWDNWNINMSADDGDCCDMKMQNHHINEKTKNANLLVKKVVYKNFK